MDIKANSTEIITGVRAMERGKLSTADMTAREKWLMSIFGELDRDYYWSSGYGESARFEM